MRIHSSSLTPSPAGIGRQQLGKQNAAQIKDELKGVVFSSDYLGNNRPVLPSNIPEKTKAPLELTGLSPNLYNTAITSNHPSNSRNLKALTAYSEEFNKALLDQNARLSKGIDAYA